MCEKNQLEQCLHEWTLHCIEGSDKILFNKRLTGSTSSTLYHISSDKKKDYVIRLFDQKDWLKEEPDLAQHEANSLNYAAKVGIPTPELIAVDEHGSSCGIPLVLMTFLEGSVQLKPRDVTKWIDGLARALVKIHKLDGEGFGWAYFPYQNIHTFKIPTWSSVPQLWERAIEIVKKPQPVDRICFNHRDYHPVNVLWQNGEVSGVVDWVNACRGPAGVDIGHCRVNLALLYGVKTADLFLKAYEGYAGATQDNQIYWDLRSIIDISFGPPTVYSGWEAFGITGLTNRMMEERLDVYLNSLF